MGHMQRRWLSWIVGILLWASLPLQAQTTRSVTFTASSDHATIAQGVSVVDHYELLVTPQGGQPLLPLNLQKPTPTNNVISVPITAFLNGLPPGTYTAVVRAVGPGGVGGSPASPPFTLVVPVPAAPGAPAISSGGF